MNRPLERFWFLENLARMPYFAYISCLHFYETIGVWRIDDNLREVHYKEEANESNHLIIMESLGGNKYWIDRFIARHLSLMYYTVLVILYFATPSVAYKASELLERHAVDTYETFKIKNKRRLKQMPPSSFAKRYYKSKCKNLYDVFSLICLDEYEHANEMQYLNIINTEINITMHLS